MLHFLHAGKGKRTDDIKVGRQKKNTCTYVNKERGPPKQKAAELRTFSPTARVDTSLSSFQNRLLISFISELNINFLTAFELTPRIPLCPFRE